MPSSRCRFITLVIVELTDGNETGIQGASNTYFMQTTIRRQLGMLFYTLCTLAVRVAILKEGYNIARCMLCKQTVPMVQQYDLRCVPDAGRQAYEAARQSTLLEHGHPRVVGLVLLPALLLVLLVILLLVILLLAGKCWVALLV